MLWSPWKKEDDSTKNDAGSGPSDISNISSSSTSRSSPTVTNNTSVSTSSPTGSSSLHTSETTTPSLQTPSGAAPMLPAAPGVTPGALMQGMFHHALNTNIGKAVFNIYGSNPPPALEATSSPDPKAVLDVASNSSSRPSRASSAGLDLPTNPIPTPQTGPEIYVHHLMTKNRGYPLWIPSPNRRLPVTYRASGVGFGDVGILMPEGGFSFLFNVVHDATHPINASRRMPEGFTPFTAWNPDDLEEYEEFSAGSYLADESLVRTDSGNDTFKTTLKSSSVEAAVLMMPESVFLSILHNTAPFRKYVRDNITSWYRFIKTDLGREISNGEVRVVYGCRKSAGFGIATIPSNRSADVSTELTFITNGVTGCKYHWHHRGSAEAKAGPSLAESQAILHQRDIPDTAVHTTITNQCLFVSTIDFTLPENQWQSITLGEPVFTSQNSQSTTPHPSHSTSPSDGPTSDSSNSNIPQRGQGAKTSRPQDTSTLVPHDDIEFWPSITPSKRLFHPSDIIADFLLRAFPHATSVSVCSDNWGPGMTDSMDTVATLISNVLSFNDVCEDNGMIYLQASDRRMVINHLKLVSPPAMQRLWGEWRDQHNLSLIWSRHNRGPGQVLTPSFPDFVETHLASYTYEISGSGPEDGTLHSLERPPQDNAICQHMITGTSQDVPSNSLSDLENFQGLKTYLYRRSSNTPSFWLKNEDNLSAAEHPGFEEAHDLIVTGELSVSNIPSLPANRYEELQLQKSMAQDRDEKALKIIEGLAFQREQPALDADPFAHIVEPKNASTSDFQHLDDEPMITTEHRDIPLETQWLGHMYHAPLHLDSWAINQHDQIGSRQISDSWDAVYRFKTTHSYPGPSGPSNNSLPSPSDQLTSQNTLVPYSFSPGTPSLSHSCTTESSPSLCSYHSPYSPGSVNLTMMPSPYIHDMKRILKPENVDSEAPQRKLTAEEQLHLFREALKLPLDNAGPFLPQRIFKPGTSSDRKHFTEDVLLEEPLYFITETHTKQFGISLKDAMHSRTRHLTNHDQVVFKGCGPSVSIRIEWPGHWPWSRQIPTKDFRSPPQPITLAKLAKNIAKCVARFIQERKDHPMEEGSSGSLDGYNPEDWRFGDGPNDIKLEDLILVSMHHVSLGSWQPQLRLVRPRAPRRHTAPAALVLPQGGGSHSRFVPYGPGPGHYENRMNVTPYYYYPM